MPLVEVDEAELAQARLATQLLQKLEGDSKTRRKLFELVKVVNPDAKIPELDAAAPLEAELGKTKTEFTEELGKVRGELAEFKSAIKSDREIREARNALRGRGWDADGIAKIEKVMTDRGIVDYDVAEAFVEKTIKPPESADKGYQYEPTWDFSPADESDEVTKMLLQKNYRKATAKAVNDWMAENKGGRAA